MPKESSYLELMCSFWNFAESQIREAGDGLAYYGTGEAAHWPIQSNYNVAGALAVLGTTAEDIPHDKDEILETALKLFRYNMACHATGSCKCSCGEQWGGSWISVLGLERMNMAQLLLEPYFTQADHKAFRALRLYESDWLLTGYETVAGMAATSGMNKPESNYWNGSFLFRTAMDYPDAPNRDSYLEKGYELLLNAISHPLDAASTEEFHGKQLLLWHKGFNFTPEYSLDHHGYMNIGYSVITLSHAAYLYFYCKERKWQFPKAATLHLKDLWEVVKKFIFPDGRLLRIGGDTRARYCYCQMYLLPILLMMEDLYKDEEAAHFETGMLQLLKKEMLCNSDGSFFGTRLADMKWQSRYYYTRLESDAIAVLGMGAAVRRKYALLQEPESPFIPESTQWYAPFHSAALVRTEKTARSFVRSGGGGPVVLNVPLANSDMAEWGGNGFAFLGAYGIKTDKKSSRSHVTEFPGGFCAVSRWEHVEYHPRGEGEKNYALAESRSACAALPDGKSMIVLEKVTALKEHNLHEFCTLNWQIPNDLFNDGKRTFYGENFRKTLCSSDRNEVIETNSRCINADDKISFILGYGANSLKIYAPEKPRGVLLHCSDINSIYVNVICGEVALDPRKFYMPGEILADTGYAVISDVSSEEGSRCRLERLEAPEALRAVRYTAPDGQNWIFIANFSNEDLLWEGKKLSAGKSVLEKLKS